MMDPKSAKSDARLDYQEQAASPGPRTYARAGQMWTNEEKLNLVQRIRSGESIEEIAEQLQRSPSAIRTKLEEKGLLASREPDVELETAFNDAMLDVYDVAARHNYHARRFKQLVKNRGGVEAARLLLARDKVTTGLTKLQQLELLDHSAEAAVLEERFRPLFTEAEREKARRRLEALGFRPQ